MFPAGLSAANLLGFTTQAPAQIELATTALSLPAQLLGKEERVYTRRPEAWKTLSDSEAAILEFLRRRGTDSELSPKQTVQKLLKLLSAEDRFERLLKVAASEPPRVSAMLGAIGEQLGYSARSLQKLRNRLNPLSRFDFGLLSCLRHAGKWQAKECSFDETV